jgi:hypothetical protein
LMSRLQGQTLVFQQLLTVVQKWFQTKVWLCVDRA